MILPNILPKGACAVKRGIIAVILVVLIAALALSGCGQSHPKNIVSDFLTLIQKGDYGAAYDMLSAFAKEKYSLDSFTKLMQDKDNSLGKITKFEYKKGFLGAEQSSMVFTITRTKDGKDTTVEATFGMRLDQGKWRITDGF